MASLLVVGLLACARPSPESHTEIRKAPEPAVAAASKSSLLGAEPALVATIYDHVGARIAIDARPATAISQHMIAGSPAKASFYAEAVAGGGDFVAYSAAEPSCPDVIRLIGIVITVSGGGKGQKLSAPYQETQLDVESFACLGAP